MEAVGFEESNDVLGPPSGEPEAAPGEDGVRSLSVWRGEVEGRQVVLSKWRPSAEELERLAAGGFLWLGVLGPSMPAVYLTTLDPFGD